MKDSKLSTATKHRMAGVSIASMRAAKYRSVLHESDKMLPNNRGGNAVDLICAHLNAPYGLVVKPADLIHSLRSGAVRAQSDLAAAIMTSLFIEVEPPLLVRCATECGVDIANLNDLYLNILAGGGVASPEWQKSVEHLF